MKIGFIWLYGDGAENINGSALLLMCLDAHYEAQRIAFIPRCLLKSMGGCRTVADKRYSLDTLKDNAHRSRNT